VRRTTVPYQCERVYNGRAVTVVIPDLAVPRCANCGELVFDYLAEEQINQAYRAQTEGSPAQVNGGPGPSCPALED
jgi:hypothetical protein